ncbi:hypothetical protein HanXRQr2_Chr12g0542671 [Helianthus annuus]|uniref:Uncharacterized protein n=1 Tax=Helianthus annuus TaxID=4232 RepID=A0A9K3MW71_HELAN|nr:hypothetical protein HanXRQr2_Chr12g0542671 [Helianthus annuus]KAJ0493309.1 hypothetical protein HanIR_Chr12g0584721 [Helianthus annuus]
MYIKTIHFGATWHNFNPLIATWQFNTPLNIRLSGNPIQSILKTLFSHTSVSPSFPSILLFSFSHAASQTRSHTMSSLFNQSLKP